MKALLTLKLGGVVEVPVSHLSVIAGLLIQESGNEIYTQTLSGKMYLIKSIEFVR